MPDHEKKNEQLLAEIKALKLKLAELESYKKKQKKVEVELHTLKEVLEVMVSNVPNQVFWKNSDLIYTGCNQAFADVVGMKDPSGVIGKSDYDFLRDATHAESYRKWDKKIIESGEPLLDIEELYHNSDGTEGTVITSKVPFKNKEGKVVGILGICTDISERKKVEQENESLIRELKDAISKVKTLSGLLPMCANCKKIKDDKGYWKKIESFIMEHSEAAFSHSICSDCAKELYPDYVDEKGDVLRP